MFTKQVKKVIYWLISFLFSFAMDKLLLLVVYAFQNNINGHKSESALELHSRAAPSVEAHHRVSGPNTERNSQGRRMI